MVNLTFGVRAGKSSLDSASVRHSGWCDQLLIFFYLSGLDGTRTRDPLRDRQAF